MTAQQTQNLRLCSIHRKVVKAEIKEINQKVCVPESEHPWFEIEDRKYCLFHMQDKGEHLEKFNRIVKARFSDAVKDTTKTNTGVQNGQQRPNNEGSEKKDEYDFRFVWFPEKLDLVDHQFNSKVDFRSATFAAGADFNRTKFNERVIFARTKFMDKADFFAAKFCKEVYFDSTEFYKGVSFNSAFFSADSDVLFRNALLNEKIIFRYCTSEGNLRFRNLQWNEETFFDFEETSFEKAIRISFHNSLLKPWWFLHADCLKISFVNVDWVGIESKAIKNDLRKELEKLSEQNIKHPKKLFRKVCWQLAENAESNNRFEESSCFRRMAFETEWIEIGEKSDEWFNEILDAKKEIAINFGGEKVDLLAPSKKVLYIIRHFEFPHLFYRYVSDYGESWKKALVILGVAVFLFFPFVYSNLIEFQVTPSNIPLEIVVKDCKDVMDELKPVCKIENRNLYFFSEAIPHSLATASLQTVEHRIPKTNWGNVWLIVEHIFAPLQAALLALALRRKFMR